MGSQFVAIAGHLAFAIIMIVVLLRAEFSAIWVVLGAAVYYTSSTNLSLLTIGGGLERILISHQRETTERRRPSIVPRAQLSTDSLQTGSTALTPASPTFVPAVEPSAQREAVLWAMTLYDEDGMPDGSRLNLKGDKELPGRLRVAAPGEAAKQFLLAKHVLQRVDHGFRLHLGRFPDVHSLRGLLDS